MNNQTVIHGLRCIGVAGCLLFSLAAHAVPSVKIGTAALIDPGTANGAFPTAADSAHTNSLNTIGMPSEIVELARALKNDPDLIYDYVRNNIETTWMYGLQKGAVGAIVDKSGTPFDQAHLMVQLLRQAGYPSATYKVGTITLNATQFSDWTGITSASAACQLLASGGIPATVNSSTNVTDCTTLGGSVSSITLAHVWVSVSISGSAYVFDPSYKPYAVKPGVNLASVAGLTSGQAMTQVAVGMATGTAATNVPYSVNLGVEGLNTTVKGYATNLLSYTQSTLPAGEVEDLVGGTSIVRYELSTSGPLRQASLPYTSVELRSPWTGEIPDQYRTWLQVQVTKPSCTTGTYSTIIDQKLYADDIYARKLVLGGSFTLTGTSSTVALTALSEAGTGTTIASANYACNPAWNVGTLTLTANHPYPAAASGAATTGGDYMDAVVTKTVSYALPLVIVHGWGDTGRGLVEKWGSRMDKVLPPLITSGCETCSTTFLGSQGDARREQLTASWLAQSSQAARLHAAIAKSVYLHHHSIGVVEADAEVKQVDFFPNGSPTPNKRYTISDSFDRLDIESGFSLTSRTADAVTRRAAVHAIAATMDALEGSVPAQIADLPDTSSTATRFEWGNRPPSSEDPAPPPLSGTPRRFYEFTATNYSQAPSLVKVEAQTSTTENGIHDGHTAEIGSTEFFNRMNALSDAIGSYATAGFKVVASEDAFLGPGQRAGAFIDAAPNNWSHHFSKQRSGALIATKYSTAGDPVEIAHLTVGPPGVTSKGGGGGAQPGHQAQYDPSQAADVLKSRFVDRSKALGVDLLGGGVGAVSPASISIGSGGFPYELSASLIWTGGNQRISALGPVSHTEPQSPWTTNWNNTLTVSGSGMEMMDGDIRAAAGTIAAFMAAQDVYKSAVSAQREAAGALIDAWWVRQLTGTVVTVNVGADTRQFVRLFDDAPANITWIATGPGSHATLTQTGTRTAYEEPACGNGGEPSYVLTRGWNYSGVSYQVKNAQGDTEQFVFWQSDFTDGTSYCANLRGFRMSNWTFPQGVTVNLVYSGGTTQGTVPELTEVNNSLGRKITFINSGRGGFNNGLSGGDARSVSVTGDPAAAGTIVHTEAGGAVNKFAVSIVGEKYLLTQIYDADSGAVPALQYDYDSLRRVREARDAVTLKVGGRPQYQFLLADGVRGERIDPAGGHYVVLYDDKKHAFRYTDEIGRTTSVTYDGRGRVKQYIYPELDRENFEYDARNNPTELARWPKGCTQEPCTPAALKIRADWHTTWNKPNWIRDAKNNQTDFTYYASGNGTSLSNTVTRPADSHAVRPVYSFTYNSRGQVLDATDPTALVTRNTYDPTNGNLLSTALNPTGLNLLTSFAYDAIGNVTSVTDPRLNVAENTYDNNRRKTVTRHHNGNIAAAVIAAERTNFDALGRATTEEGGTVFSGTTVTTWQTLKTTTYTKTSKVSTEQNNAGNTTTFAYDSMDRVEQVTDPLSPPRITRLQYNLAGEILKEIRAYGTAIQQDYATYIYTPNGQRQTVKDANNNLSTFEFDGFDRLTKLRFPLPTLGVNQSSTTDYEQYGYDENGNRLSLRKRDAQVIAYTYDALNRVTLKDVPGTAIDVYSEFDLAGRPLWNRFASTSGQGIVYGYDSAKRLTSEASFGRTMTYNYDAASNRNFVQWPDANYISYSFDALNRMTEVRENTATPGAAVLQSYFWDPLSRRSSTTPLSRANGTSTGYAYDAASRLTGLSHDLAGTTQDFALGFHYTPASQMDSRTISNNAFGWWTAPEKVHAYAANGLNEYTSVNGVTFSNDANGNLTGDGTRTFAYDVENRLVTLSGPVAGTLDYDPLGRLKQTTLAGTTTQFLYDGDRLAVEYDGSGNIVRRYVHGSDVDEPIVWYEGAALTTKRWLHSDERGSVIAYSDAAGAATGYTYGPYGEQPTGTWTGSRFRYTGQIMLPEAQLYYYKARVYDPSIGRFLQTDPIGYKDDFNLYAYVRNDPLNRTDPSGTEGEFALLGAVVAFAGADAATPEPTDAAAPIKATVYAGAIIGTAIGGAAVFVYNKATETPDKPIVENRSKPAGPDPDAEGRPHSVPDGNGGYTTYGPRDPVTGQPESTKQYRPEGKPHGPVPRPNVKDRPANQRPDGAKVPGKPEVRPPTPEEIRKPKV